jgi:hypothetical protein
VAFVFVRVLQGLVGDERGVRAELDRWRRELAPGGGWRWLTAGVADGAELVALFAFDGPAAARQARPDAAGWQAALERHLIGPAGWHDCLAVHELKGGAAADAGFVVVVQGRLADPARLAAMRGQVERTLRAHAPQVLGVVTAEHADDPGAFTEATYYTSERAARAAEREMPVEVAVQLGTVRSYLEGLRFLELRDPVLERPARASAASGRPS